MNWNKYPTLKQGKIIKQLLFSRYTILFLFCISYHFLFSQINTFPYRETFESPFVEGDNVEFLPDWIGNEVKSSTRIHRANVTNSGAGALAITPTSLFSAEVVIHLDMIGVSEAVFSFRAKSFQNGSATSSRPALVYLSTSVDQGTHYTAPQKIGDETTFINANTNFQSYAYSLGEIANNQSNVSVKIVVERGEGIGSAATLVLDDVIIEVEVFEDATPPTIIACVAVDVNTVSVTFDEAIARFESLENYTVTPSIEVTSVELQSEQKVILSTGPLENGDTYRLLCKGILDLKGNQIKDTVVRFQYLSLEEAVFGDIVINEFMADPTPSHGLPESDFIELYNASEKFIALSNWTISDHIKTSSAFEDVVLRPEDYLILCDSKFVEEFIIYGHAIPLTSFPSFNATSTDKVVLKNNNGETIDSISYPTGFPKDGFSEELVNPHYPCHHIGNYRTSLNPIGGTPGQRNSQFDVSEDKTKPHVKNHQYGETLEIVFSEYIIPSSFSSDNLQSNLGSINEIRFDEMHTSVNIIFDQLPEEGVEYFIKVEDIHDCAQNMLRDTTLLFGIGAMPMFNELIITEIMADPTPSVGLPAREYLELMNISSNLLSLEGVILSDNTSEVILPKFLLRSGEIILLTSTQAQGEFEKNTLYLNGFPTLNDGGESLVMTHTNQLIFSVAYTQKWHTGEHAGGGYSLEMKDVTSPCVEERNWTTSIHLTGGTPGKENASREVISDRFSPTIQKIGVVDIDTIRIIFDEKINPNTVHKAVIRLTPNVSITNKIFKTKYPHSMFLSLGQSLQENVQYQLMIQGGVSDCVGNVISEEMAEVVLPSTPLKGDILINEILFNPKSGGVDFIEIINTSDKYLSLSTMKLARLVNGDVKDEVSLSEGLAIAPLDLMVFTSNNEILLSHYPVSNEDKFEETEIPTLPNDSGRVLIFSNEEEHFDELHYHDDFHFELLLSVDGVSLERISTQSSTSNSNNWKSASSNSGFATPGLPNSHSADNPDRRDHFEVMPQVFSPNSGLGNDFCAIHYHFTTPENITSIIIYDEHGREVKHLVEGAFLVGDDFVRWDGTNNVGDLVSKGIYVILIDIFDSSGRKERHTKTVVINNNQ